MAKVPTIRVWDGEGFVDWPEDEPLYCGDCGVSLAGADDVYGRGRAQHGPGCDAEDGDAAFAELADRLRAELDEAASVGVDAYLGRVRAEQEGA